MSDPIIGVIGGTGLYAMPDLQEVQRLDVDTPFGKPSDTIIKGTLGGRTVCFVPRHGVGHRLTPSEVPYRANLFALKSLGVSRVIAISAVGSMREEIQPGDIVVVNQFIDRSWKRETSFFGQGIVGHVSFADPVCPDLRQVVIGAARRAGARVHAQGTYICIEGPQFSTRAESEGYRQMGVHVIGMTNATEAKLAREAELCFTTVALATDYDCWHATEEDVTVEAIMALLHKNAALSQQIVREAVPAIGATPQCHCQSAAAHAICTTADRIPAARKQALAPLYGKYLNR